MKDKNMEDTGKEINSKEEEKPVRGFLKRIFKRSGKHQKEKKHHVVHVVVERTQDNL